MPIASNITVKKNDGTTDVVYSLLTPSSGEGQPCVLRSETASTVNAAKPVLSIASKWNGPRTARRLDVTFKFPQPATDSTTSLVSVVNTVPLTLSGVIPSGVPDAVVAEAVSQFFNLVNSTLVKDSFKTGFAPT